MVKMRWLKSYKNSKVGTIFTSSKKSAENFVNQGYAEFIQEEKPIKKKKVIKEKKTIEEPPIKPILSDEQINKEIETVFQLETPLEINKKLRELVEKSGLSLTLLQRQLNHLKKQLKNRENNEIKSFLNRKTEIQPIKEEQIEKVDGLLTEEQFEKLDNPTYDLKKEEEKTHELMVECYRNIIDTLKKYCDLKEEYYNIIALWIIGTYFHNEFPTYPYLFINAMKGSGKSRLQRLIVFCSKGGSMLNSLTEAVLFRTTGTLGIDEFEGMSRKGNEALKELLNSAYKKGIKVKRMRKQKTLQGEQQVVEEFDVFRPITLANIGGIESVLADRCITIILDKSDNRQIIDLIELFESETTLLKTLTTLNSEGKCSLCSMYTLRNVYEGWNLRVINNNFFDKKTNTNSLRTDTTQTTQHTLTTLTTQTTPIEEMYKKIREANISGRDLEIVFPLLIIAEMIGVLDVTIKTCQEIVQERRQEDAIETTDISLIDFVSMELEYKFVLIQELTRRFKEFLQSNDEWITDRWMGRALKRLNLIKEKKRINRGVTVILNIEKAQEKIRMFK